MACTRKINVIAIPINTSVLYLLLGLLLLLIWPLLLYTRESKAAPGRL